MLREFMVTSINGVCNYTEHRLDSICGCLLALSTNQQTQLRASRLCILDRCADLVERFEQCCPDEVRLFGPERNAQSKMTVRLLEDLRQRSHEPGHPDDHIKLVDISVKKVNFVNEVARAINTHGVSSSSFGSTYDRLCHFLSLEPVVSDLQVPAWITQARFHSKAQEVPPELFWTFIDDASLAAHQFKEDAFAGAQRGAVEQRLLALTRENDDGMAGRLRAFTEDVLRQNAKVDDEVLQGIVLIGHLVRPEGSAAKMLEDAIAAGRVDNSVANIITTYPGGRKVLQDAEVALSAKLAGQEALVAYTLALELFREQVVAPSNGHIYMFSQYTFYEVERVGRYS